MISEPEMRPILDTGGAEGPVALRWPDGWFGVVVSGDPVAWERVVRTSTGRGRVPAKTRRAKRDIGNAIKAAWMGVEPAANVSIALRLRFYVKDRRRRDIDNLEKVILDALTGIVYADDSQVDAVDKAIVRGAGRPRSEIAWKVLELTEWEV